MCYNIFMKKSNKPIIGLTSHSISTTIADSLGTNKLCLNEDYIRSVELGGGIPIILPAIHELSGVARYVTLIDGLLLTGGDDVDPLLYGEEPSPKLMATKPERDRFELAIIREALKQSKPIFGICRGLQILNVALGGSLFQDIPSEAPGKLLLHRQLSKESVATHSVDLLPGSKLGRILQEKSVATNSFHHQAIKKLAPGLTATAFSRDGIIEGIEMAGNLFVAGVQWHPECMVSSDPKMLRLFTAFSAVCAGEELFS